MDRSFRNNLFAGALALGISIPGAVAADLPVPVVEASQQRPGSSPNAYESPATPPPVIRPRTSPGLPAAGQGNSNSPAVLLYNLELLQQEVLELRGLVEQQAYQIQQMREEQRDRYLDLDRRIGLIGAGGAVAGRNMEAGAGAAISQSGAPKAGDKAAYDAAFELIRKKKYADAVAALLQFTETFKDSAYAGNAYYWLGEVQLVQANYQDALQAFGLLLNKFPEHRKIPDAKFKLAKVYRQLGDNAKAKTLLQEVVNKHGGTSAAKLAESELRKAS